MRSKTRKTKNENPAVREKSAYARPNAIKRHKYQGIIFPIRLSGDLMVVRQSSFDDLRKEEEGRRYVRKLTQKQLDIIEFIRRDYYQAYIADRLKISRAYVNQTVNSLLKFGLIKQKTCSPLQKKSLTYEPTKRLDIYLSQSELMPSQYTLCIPHHIKFKYPLLEMTGELNRDGWKFSKNRSVFIRSWKPKGNERLLFNVNLGDNTISIQYQGKSLIASRVEHTKVVAQSITEATQIIASEIGKGVEIFLREQKSSGCQIKVGQPKQIDRTHYAFESELAKEMVKNGQQSQLEGVYVDNSPEGQGKEKVGDIEMRDPIKANSVDQGLRNAMNIDKIVRKEIGQALPAAMKEFNKSLEPMNENISQVMAMLQGSITVAQQNDNILKFFSKIMNEMQDMRSEYADMKRKYELAMKGGKP